MVSSMASSMVSWIVLMFLGIEGIMDLVTRKINILLAVVFVVTGGIYGIISGNDVRIFYGVLPGAVMLAAAYILKNIGAGDGIILMATGIWMGFGKVLFLIWISLLFAGVGGGVLCLINKKGKKYKIPYIPFVFLGYLLMMIMNMG